MKFKFKRIHNYLICLFVCFLLLKMWIVSCVDISNIQDTVQTEVAQTSTTVTTTKATETAQEVTTTKVTTTEVATTLETTQSSAASTYIEKQEARYTYSTRLSDAEINTLACLIFLESGSQSQTCQYAICSVVLNRMNLWDMTLDEVVYQQCNGTYQFSPCMYIPYTEPEQEQYDIIIDVLENGVTIEPYICYFRAGYYHSWDGMHNAFEVDNVHFSYSERDYNLYLEDL